MKKKSMILISGTGSGKKRTIPACSKSDVVVVKGVHGRDLAKLQSLNKDYPHLLVSNDIDELLINQFDIAYIASPPFKHREECMKVIEHVNAVICEKPLALTVSDAKSILNCVLKNKCHFMLAHHLRHSFIAREIKRIIGENYFGRVKSVNLNWNFILDNNANNSKWKTDPELGGGNSMYDAGVHCIDFAIYVWGRPDRVYARGCDFSNGYYGSISAVLEYDGFSITIGASHKQSTIGNDLVIYCEKGVLYAEGFFSENSSNSLHVKGKDRSEVIVCDAKNLYMAEVEDFCQHLEGGELVGTTIFESYYSVVIMESIKKSLDSGVPVTVDYEV
jgi:predicted dehydrogenase